MTPQDKPPPVGEKLSSSDDGQPASAIETGVPAHPRMERFRAIFEQSSVGLVLADAEGVVQSVNPAFCRITGFPAEELLGVNARLKTHPSDWDKTVRELAKVVSGGAQDCTFEKRYIRKDGAIAWTRVNLSQMRETADAPPGILAVVEDITAQKRAEREAAAADVRTAAALESERAQLADIFKRSPSFMAVLRGPDHVFQMANDCYYDLVGPRDLLKRPVREALPEIARQGFIKVLDQVYATGLPFRGNDVRVKLQKSPGQPLETRYLNFVFQAMRELDGTIHGIFVHGVDISELKKGSRKLQRLAEQRRLALDSAKMGWWHLDVRARRVHGDERFCSILGVSATEHESASLLERVHPEDRPRVIAATEAATQSEEFGAYCEECRILTPDGTVRWVHGNARAYFADDEPERRAISLVGTVTDITESKLAQQTLEESEARFRNLADAMPQIVFMALPDGQIDYFNRQWYEYTGIAQGVIDYESWKHVHEPEKLSRAIQLWAAATASGTPYEMEYRLRRADGEYRWHLGRALPVKDAEGNVLRWFGTNTDIHDHKQLQEQHLAVLESERAARSEAERASRMKDEFLSTVSHELRTPLNAIMGWAHLLRRHVSDPVQIEEGLRVIERNARAQKQIIEDLLDMSRIISGKVRLEVQPLDLATVLRAAMDTVQPAATAKGIDFQATIDPLPRPVTCDPSRLQQVFWNLLSNAVKFTPRGGRVTVSLERVESHLEVKVADTGDGISPEFLPQVFDRFRQADASSTRRHGGLGLGLGIVKQLVELHGGSVRAVSDGLGCGTTMTVTLPLLAVNADPQPERDPISPEADNNLTQMTAHFDIHGLRVLVVDDEADARALVARFLEDHGAIVEMAGSVAEALVCFARQRPDILVSDIGMPEEDGYSLVRRIRARETASGSAAVPAIALTAYARAEDRMNALVAGFQMHLPKPVESAELLAVVASLGGRTSPP